MNFKEIKAELVNKLKGYTIDDYFMNRALVLQLFIDIPHIKETILTKIKNNNVDYSVDYSLPDASQVSYDEYVYEILEDKLKNSIPALNIEPLKSEYDSIINNINNLFSEFDSKIESSKKLNTSEDYFKIKENELNLYLAELNSCKSKIQSLIDEYRTEINHLIKGYSDLVKFILAIESSTKYNEIFLNTENQNSQPRFRKIGSIHSNRESITSIYLNDKSKRPTYYKWSEERRFSHIQVNIEDFGNVSFIGYSSEHYESLIRPYIKKENVIPGNWRDVLSNLFLNPFDDISQPVDINPYYQNSSSSFGDFFKLNDCDIATILATRIAVESNSFIISENNSVVLTISGGIMAKIFFRKKGCFLRNEKFRIVRKTYANYKSQLVSLYKIDGYASSSINIEVPSPYLFITDKYVVQIEYLPAPVLLESNTATKVTDDLSSSKKLEDEYYEHKKLEEKKKEEEEERKKREEEEEDENRKKYD